MKKAIFSLVVSLMALSAMAQPAPCSDLFISTYVEGYGNNRALQLYNPTSSAINLSQYSVGRFNNGGVTYIGIPLPNRMLQPHRTYTVVLDKRVMTGTGLETPVWNGYLLVDTLFDSVTGLPRLDANGNVIMGVQYDASGNALYGSVYYDSLDLQGRADTFACPNYSVNSAMYFNGNDAVALIKGMSPSPSGNNILDVIGVIGQDPGESWLTSTGEWVTKDRTLQRKFSIRNGTGPIAAALPAPLNAFNDQQWDIYPKNTFTVLDNFTCVCNTTVSVGGMVLESAEVTVHPNPVSGTGLLWLEAAENELVGAELFNTLGQCVQAERFAGGRQAWLALSGVPAGMYVLRVSVAGGQVATRKVVVR